MRFGGVGALATGVHLVAAAAAHAALGLDPLIANACGFAVAFLVSFWGHFWFTFALREGHWAALPRFLAVALSGFLLSQVVIWTLAERLGLPFLVALVAANLVVPVYSFVLSRLWAFRPAVRADLVPLALVVAVGVAAAFYSGQMLNHDSSWYLIATRKWLEVATLYRDVIEINPPLAFALTVPALLLSDALAVTESSAFVLWVATVSLFSLLLLWKVLPRLGLVQAAQHGMLGGATLALLVLPLTDFGQREHLLLALALPYLVLLSADPEARRLAWRWEAGLALLAAIGLALKPHYALGPMLLVAASAWQCRSFRPLLRPGNLVVAAVAAGYLLLTALLFPDYFTVILPAAQLVYWALDANPVRLLLWPAAAILPVAVLVLLLGRDRRLAARLALATAGLAAGYLLQGKGWGYHLLPAAGFVLVALGWTLTSLEQRARQVLAVLAGGMVLGFSVMLGPYANPYVAAFEAEVGAAGPDAALLVLSDRVIAGFPLANRTGAEWVSRFPHQWFVPGAVRILASEECPVAPQCAAAQALLDQARRWTVDDFLRAPPDVVLVDVHASKTYFGGVAFDYLSWLETDPRFAEAFAPYTMTSAHSGHQIWRTQP